MCLWGEPACHIVGGGDFDEKKFTPAPCDMVIAADCGYAHLQKIGHAPKIVVGDFDSLGYIPEHKNVLRLPVEKDDTDMMYAVKVGIEQGYRRFFIHGALGGERFDHSIANIQTLLFLTTCGAKGRLLGGDGTVITAVRDGKLTFPEEQEGTLSVFAMGECAEGVSLSGVKYPLEDSTLTNEYPLGVSNSFTGVPAEVSVRKGTLLVIWKE